MKLNEIKIEKIKATILSRQYLYYELELTDEFTQQDASELVKALGPKIGRGYFTKGHVGMEGMWYEILYSTQYEAIQAEKTLRRRSRGKPRFNVTFVTTSRHSSAPGIHERVRLTREVN